MMSSKWQERDSRKMQKQTLALQQTEKQAEEEKRENSERICEKKSSAKEVEPSSKDKAHLGEENETRNEEKTNAKKTVKVRGIKVMEELLEEQKKLEERERRRLMKTHSNVAQDDQKEEKITQPEIKEEKKKKKKSMGRERKNLQKETPIFLKRRRSSGEFEKIFGDQAVIETDEGR